MKTENTKEAEQRRLAWRCRRGMLELDITLQKFVAAYFDKLTTAEMEAFDALLSMTDKELWNVLGMKNLHLKNKMQQSIIDKLHRLQTVKT